MKKKIFLLVIALIMCIGNSCFAADNGSVLNSEEKVAYKVIEALVGNRPYADIQQDLAPNMIKEFDNKKFEETKVLVKNKFGTLSNAKLVILEKRDMVDRLFYLANGTKEKAVEIMLGYDIKGKKPLILELTMRGLPVESQQPAASKK